MVDIPLSPQGQGWAQRAYNSRPQYSSGEADVVQASIGNRSGAEQITATHTNKQAPSMAEKVGTNTHGSDPHLVRKYKPVNGVSTALHPEVAAMSAALSALIPGLPFSLGNLLNMIPAEIKKQIFKDLPPGVGQALQNTLNLIGTHTPKNGTNFVQAASNVDPTKFAANAAKVLSGLTSIADIPAALQKLGSSDPAITGMSSAGLGILIQGPFGPINLSINPSTGSVSIVNLGDINKLVSQFSGVISNISSAAGPFLNNGTIPTELLSRLPVQAQTAVKQALAAKDQNGHNILNAAAKTFFGG